MKESEETVEDKEEMDFEGIHYQSKIDRLYEPFTGCGM